MINSITRKADKYNRTRTNRPGFLRLRIAFFFIKKKNSNSRLNPIQPGQKKKFNKAERLASIEKAAKEARQADRLKKEKEYKPSVIDPATEKRRRLFKMKTSALNRKKKKFEKKKIIIENIRNAVESKKLKIMIARRLVDERNIWSYPLIDKWVLSLCNMKNNKKIIINRISKNVGNNYWYNGDWWSTKKMDDAEIILRKTMGTIATPTLFTNLRQLIMWKGDINILLDIIHTSGFFFIKNTGSGNHFKDEILYRDFTNRKVNNSYGECYINNRLGPQGIPGFFFNFEKMNIKANTIWIQNFISLIEYFFDVKVKVTNWDIVLKGKNVHEPSSIDNLKNLCDEEYFSANKINWLIINTDKNPDQSWFTDCIGNCEVYYSDDGELMEKINGPKKIKNKSKRFKKDLLKEKTTDVELDEMDTPLEHAPYPKPHNNEQQIAKFSKVIKTSGNARNYHNYVIDQLYKRDFIQFYIKNENLLIRKKIDNSNFDHQKYLYRRITGMQQKDLIDVFLRYVKVTKPAMVYYIVKKRSFLKKRKIFLTSFKLKMIKDFNREGKLFSMIKSLYMDGKTRRVRAGLKNSTDIFLDKEVYKVGKSDLLRKQKSVYDRSGHEAINDILKKIN